MSALTPVEAFDHALAGGAWHVALDNGARVAVPFARFTGLATPAERRLLARAKGPVLDIGCGPGRHVQELLDRGVPALGVDVAPGAIARAHRRGVPVHAASIFDDNVPRAGTWQTALLLDGNIGIGGSPRRLLGRVHELLAPGGIALVECDQSGLAATVGRAVARLVGPTGTSQPFPWALVTAHALQTAAQRADLVVVEVWEDHGRSFAALRKCAAP